MKLALFLQARLTSKRFPKKIFSVINNKTLIEILIKKLKKVKNVSKIIIVIPNSRKNNELALNLRKLKVTVFRGKENNVLDRFYKAALKFKVKNIIRITADCPLIDTKLIDQIVKKYFNGKYDYATNTFPPSYPDGLDVEIFNFASLKKAWLNSNSQHQKEHVTPFIRNKKKFRIINILNNTNQKKIRLTIDWKEDLILIEKIFNFFKPKINFYLKDINKIIKKHPEWFKINSKYRVR